VIQEEPNCRLFQQFLTMAVNSKIIFFKLVFLGPHYMGLQMTRKGGWSLALHSTRSWSAKYVPLLNEKFREGMTIFKQATIFTLKAHLGDFRIG